MFRLGSLRWLLTLLVAVSIALFVALPLMNLIYKAGIQVTQHGDGLHALLVTIQVHWHACRRVP